MWANPSASIAPPLPSSGLSYLSISSIHGSPCTYHCNAWVRGISGYCSKFTRYGCTLVALLGRVRMLLNTSARTSNQAAPGHASKYFCSPRFTVATIRSACPFAHGFCVAMYRYYMPANLQQHEKAPWYSDPLSIRMANGVPY